MLCRVKGINVRNMFSEWLEGVKFGVDLWVENNKG